MPTQNMCNHCNEKYKEIYDWEGGRQLGMRVREEELCLRWRRACCHNKERWGGKEKYYYVLGLLALPGMQACFTNHTEEKRVVVWYLGWFTTWRWMDARATSADHVHASTIRIFFYCKPFTIINVFVFFYSF
jgi:hypothetical protein